MRDLQNNDRERRLLALANRQHGLLGYEDLTAAGLDRRAIRRRVDACRLTRVHDRVFAFGHVALSPQGWWLAALWACGPSTVLSHLSAVAFNGMRSGPLTGPVHVSTTRSVESRPGSWSTASGTWTEPTCTAAARSSSRRSPGRSLMWRTSWTGMRSGPLADAQRELRIDRIRDAQRRSTKRPGASQVTRLIEADDAHTKSELERRFLRFCVARSLPRPDGLNEWIGGHKGDCVYRAARLVVEPDGRAFHERRAQMRADRRRDSDYQLAGFHILRLVWDDLNRAEAVTTAARVRRMLAL